VSVVGSDAEPLDVRPSRIVHAISDSPHEERYCLELLDGLGRVVESLPFDTLTTATDQAMAILRVEPNEWMDPD